MAGVGDDQLPLLPADATPASPSLAEQQRQHAADNAPPPPAPGDNLPLAPPPKPSITSQSWSQLGKTLWDEGSRGLALGTRDVATGLSSLPTAALDVATWPARALQRSVGIPTDAPSTMRDKLLDAAQLPTPQTPTERAISTFNQGASASLPFAVAGAAPTVANAIRLGLQGGAGAVAGKTAASSDLVPPALKPSVDLLVSALAAKGVDVAGNLGAKGINAIAGNTNDIYNAFNRLGMDTRLVGTASGTPAGQSLEAGASRIPFASSVIKPAMQNTVDQFGARVDATAHSLDPTLTALTPQMTGNQVQNAARNWKDNFYNTTVPNAWNPLDTRLAGTSVTPTGYTKALDDLTTQLNLPETQKVLSPAIAQQLKDALTKDVGGGNLTWEQASGLRTAIGKMMGVPEISQSVGADVLKRAYAGIADDLRNTAVANGQGNVFDAANKITTDGHAFINGPLSKVISTTNPAQERITPEAATNALLNGDGTTLQAIRTNMPTTADQLAAFKLRQAQMAPPGQATSYADTSTGRFLTNINGMRQKQPDAYDALYPPGSAVRQPLEDLQTAAGALRETERHVNTSGTAEQLGVMEYLRGIKEAASKGGVSERLLNIGAAMAGPPLWGRAIGATMTDPALAKYVAARGLGMPPIAPTTSGLLGSIPQLTGQ